MEEQILIRSTGYPMKKVRNFCVWAGVLLLCVLLFVLVKQKVDEHMTNYIYIKTNSSPLYSSMRARYPNALAYTIRFEPNEVWVKIILIAVVCGSVPIVVGLFLYGWLGKTTMCVTDKRIYGCVGFGKSVNLPWNSVSAVGISWPAGVTVATTSGAVVFSGVKNRMEINKIISDILLERQ